MRGWMVGLLLVLATGARADDAMQAAAREGQALGSEQLQRGPLPPLVGGGERGQGTVRIGDDDIAVNQIVPGGSPEATAALSGLAGDRARLEAAAAERQREVARDPSHSGQALRSLSAAQRGDTAAAAAVSAGGAASASPLIAELGACRATLVHRAAGATATHVTHERSCEVLVDPPVDTCVALASEPGCRLQRRGCHEDGVDRTGRCVAESRVYRCDEVVATPNIESRRESACTSTIRCMGDDCVHSTPTAAPNGDLARATAALSIGQHVVDDWAWRPTGTSPTRVAVPQWLPGHAYTCRKAVGAASDCCGEATTDRGAAWLATYRSSTRRAGASELAARLRAGHADEHGSWTGLGTPDAWTDGALDRPLTSPLETITGGRADAGIADAGGGIHQATADYLAALRERDLPTAGWTCSAEEWDLAHLRELGSCLLVGGYCEAAGQGGCREKRDSYVCFDSPTARLLRESLAGPAAVERGVFGTPRHPKVDGLDADAARSLRVDPVVLDEIAARLTLAGAFPDAGNVVAASAEDRLTGSADLHGDPGRPPVGARTRRRLADADLRAVANAVERDQRAGLPAPIPAAKGAGDLAFDPALASVRGGQRARLVVQRIGGRLGAVSVRVTTHDVSAHAPDDYQAVDAELAWADGEDGERIVVIPTRALAVGRGTRSLEVRLGEPLGGARLYPNDRALVLIDDGPPAAAGSDPPPAGVVSVRKWIPSAPDGRLEEGRAFRWQILVANATAMAVPLVEISDRLPSNLPWSALLHVDCLAGDGVAATLSLDATSHLARCRWPADSVLAPGGTARMEIAVRGLGAGSYANDCAIDLGGATAGGSCTSVAWVQPRSSESVPPTGCAPPPAGLRRRPAPTRWDEVFDGRRFPASRDITPLFTDLGSYTALEFETRAVGSAPASAQLSWDALQRGYPSVLPDGDFYVTVSRCPGDFGLGRWPTAEPSASPGCRSIRRDAQGHFIDAGGLHLAFDGVPDRDSCHLAPATRYYLNVVFADPRPQAFGAPLFPNLAACPVSFSTCGVQAVTDFSGQ